MERHRKVWADGYGCPPFSLYCDTLECLCLAQIIIYFAVEDNKMIRIATKEDASRLAEILIFAKRMAYSNIFNNYKVSFWDMQVLPLALEYMEKPQMLENVYVFEDEVIKGMIKISYNKSDNYFEINELYIDPFFQNQHIGSHFIKHIEAMASSLGLTNIILWVLEKNQSARSFYAKHGFMATSDKKLEDGTTEYILKYLKKI